MQPCYFIRIQLKYNNIYINKQTIRQMNMNFFSYGCYPLKLMATIILHIKFITTVSAVGMVKSLV